MLKKIKVLFLSAMLILTVAGCSNQDTASEPASQAPSQASGAVSESTPTQSALDAVSSEGAPSATPNESISEAPAPAVDTPSASAGELAVHFGDDGTPFTMHLYDNPTAAAIADYVGIADWRLPIREFEGYDNWEVMQFYDLPSRYEIPSNAETVTTQKSGEVYYSEPNRIVLFYGDAEVTGEYTKIGYFDATAEFAAAVSDNPVLEGWGNKIVLIKE